MMQTLIGADGTVLKLAGRIEISSDVQEIHGHHFESTVVQAYPGVGVPVQRISLKGLRILDVETLPQTPRPLVTVERVA